jgi:hypothetical protein
MTNKKIVLASITVIVAAGLLALNPSIIGNAQGQMYDDQYRYDSNYYQDDNRYSYDKKDPKSSHVDIQKIKCVNSNLNVNGIDITEIPQDNAAVGAANEGADGANTQNGDGLADRINFERNLVNICINVNDNEQVKVSPPDETPPQETATLNVTKTVTCDEVEQDSVLSVQQEIDFCAVLESTITEDQFGITMTGDSAVPVPSQFLGSEAGQNVVLGAGGYTVTEKATSVATDVANLLADPGWQDVNDIEGPIASFTGDCTQSDDLEATGTIAAGQSQTCEITNNFIIQIGEE